jgi:hypothetical protein
MRTVLYYILQFVRGVERRRRRRLVDLFGERTNALVERIEQHLTRATNGAGKARRLIGGALGVDQLGQQKRAERRVADVHRSRQWRSERAHARLTTTTHDYDIYTVLIKIAYAMAIR